MQRSHVCYLLSIDDDEKVRNWRNYHYGTSIFIIQITHGLLMDSNPKLGWPQCYIYATLFTNTKEWQTTHRETFQSCCQQSASETKFDSLLTHCHHQNLVLFMMSNFSILSSLLAPGSVTVSTYGASRFPEMSQSHRRGDFMTTVKSLI